MGSVFTGFAVIALAVFVGWLAARTGVVGPEARPILARLNFSVLAPFLLFSVLATADVGALFSALLPVSALAAVTMMVVFGLVSMLAWRRSLERTVIGSLASGYVNGNNFGIPIAVYMLGDAAYSAPIVLLQLLLFAPVALAILGARVQGRTSAWQIVRSTFTNPIIVGSLLGVAVAVAGIELPPIVLEPVELIGHAAVPLMLISFGMSLNGQRLLAAGTGRRDVLLATTLKLVAMPVVAWLLGRFVFGLDATALYAVTVLAALPTAQNVFNYAQRYDTAEIVARDTVFITTLGCLPVLLGLALVHSLG
ncbi:AEC family transporter [Agromyces sp. H3Y2-19a]|jgi:predicted permease|uniref:AEC family transporter n=1 Tax=Agromyces chromiiresistens TaxID=3030835 RepID=UPI0023B98280|nr:AEC family transporter [Agromyces chromiiresistens]MDF0512454.1 AEC family transporter [Agromyces chromiiresistens]